MRERNREGVGDGMGKVKRQEGDITTRNKSTIITHCLPKVKPMAEIQCKVRAALLP